MPDGALGWCGAERKAWLLFSGLVAAETKRVIGWTPQGIAGTLGAP
jgi:hypothetical protein